LAEQSTDMDKARAFARAVGILDRALAKYESVLSILEDAFTTQPGREDATSALDLLRARLAARFRLAAAAMHRQLSLAGAAHPILSPWELAASAYFRVHLCLFYELDDRGAGKAHWTSGNTTGYRRSSSRMSLLDPGEEERPNARGGLVSMFTEPSTAALAPALDDSDAEMAEAGNFASSWGGRPTAETVLRDPFAAGPGASATSAPLLQVPDLNRASQGGKAASGSGSGPDMLSQLPEAPIDADLPVEIPTPVLIEGLSSFRATCAALSRFLLLRDLEPVYSDLVLDAVRAHVHRECAGQFDEHELLEKMVGWAKNVASPWIGEMVGAGGVLSGAAAKRENAQWKNRVVFHTVREFAELRISEIFDIVVEFPDSLPAVQDLKRALGHVEAIPQLVQTLKAVLHRRLLHQGAHTKDILQWYINAIKAMRILDPRGLVLARCGTGIRRYLRSREDTVRCIITNILDDVQGETFTAGEDTRQLAMDEDDEGPDDVVTDWADPNWMPAPMEADAATLAESKNAADIMATLVSIYDSKEVFIKEFQTLLADRLIGIRNYDAEREVRNLEMLKLRFGESSLATCEVMIQDLAESKRIDAAIHGSTRRPGLPLHSMVLSRLFWPTFKDDYGAEPLKVPAELEKSMADYGAGFSGIRASRSLAWMPQLGSVDIELEMADGRIIEFTNLSPVQATIINLFQERPRWTLTELSEATELDKDTLRRKIGFWVGNGLLRERRSEPDVWILIEDTGARQATSPRESFGSGGGLSPVLPGGPRKANIEFDRRMRRLSDEGKRDGGRGGAGSGATIEEMRQYDKFVLGVLRNLGAMTADQIYSRLMPFFHPPRTLADTRKLLDVMLVEDVLELHGDSFSVRRT